MRGNRLVNALRIVWAVIILWYELASFPYSVSQCPWPQLATGETLETPEATHVLLIADPQVLDYRSYPDRPPWLMWLSQRIVDLNMRKSWWATKSLHPDVIIFLGDMMDNGRFAMHDTEWESYYERFMDIFATDESIPKYYIPGNHDVGIGKSDEWSDHARERYVEHFGVPNTRFELSNHTFVLIDAPGLVEEERQRMIAGMSYSRWAAVEPEGTVAFIQQSSEVARTSAKPTILLSHIPLARSRSTDCGPLREQGRIRDGSGYGYENTLSVGVSNMLLNGIRPSIIFSGDDHDYCEISHSLSPSDDIPLSEHRDVKEISVKSFSMAMGVQRPGFQLLTLDPSSAAIPSGPTLSTAPCFLPFQLGIYVLIYGPLAAVSLLILLIHNVYRVYAPGAQTSGSSDVPFRPLPSVDKVRSSALADLSTSTHALRNYDAPDETDEAAFILPPPTPAVTVSGKNKQSRVHLFKIGSRGYIVNLSRVGDFVSFLAMGCWIRKGTDSMRLGLRRTRMLRTFFSDVLAVAWLPIAMFMSIAWWFL